MRYLAVLFIVLLSGCATVGTQIDGNYTQSIKEGVTTEREIIAALGAPLTVTQNSDGTKTLMYVYSEAQTKAATFIPVVGLFAGGTDTKSQSLVVIIKDGLVQSWSMTESEQEYKTGII